MSKIWIRPYSLDAAALEATESTLASLIGGGHFVRVENEIVQRAGWVCCDVFNAQFVVWAAVKQGYVLDAVLDILEKSS